MRFLDPKNDVAFKKVFGLPEHKRLLISLLNALLQREGEERIKDVELLPTELIPHTDVAKRSILDVRCIDERNFQYIVEIQNSYFSSFIQRIQFYTAQVFTHQIDRGQDYLALKPVILLAILNHTLFPAEIPCVSYHNNVEKTTGISYMKDISYVMVELPKFERKPGKMTSILESWLAYFKEASGQKDIPPDAPEEVQEAYHVVERMAWSCVEIEAYDRALIAYMDEKDMLRTAHDDGVKKGKEMGLQEGKELGLQEGKEMGLQEGKEMGLQEGKELGLQEGKEMGLQEGKKETALKLLSLGLADDLIQKATGLSLQEIQNLKG